MDEIISTGIQQGETFVMRCAGRKWSGISDMEVIFVFDFLV